jgi:hypothetical protein
MRPTRLFAKAIGRRGSFVAMACLVNTVTLLVASPAWSNCPVPGKAVVEHVDDVTRLNSYAEEATLCFLDGFQYPCRGGQWQKLAAFPCLPHGSDGGGVRAGSGYSPSPVTKSTGLPPTPRGQSGERVPSAAQLRECELAAARAKAVGESCAQSTSSCDPNAVMAAAHAIQTACDFQ